MKGLLFNIFMVLVIGGAIVYMALTDANVYLGSFVLFAVVTIIMVLYSKTDLSKEENTRIIPCDSSVDIKLVFDKLKSRGFKQWKRAELKAVKGLPDDTIVMENMEAEKVVFIYKDDKAKGLVLRFSDKSWGFEINRAKGLKYSEDEKQKAIAEATSFMDIEDLTVFNALHCGIGNFIRDGKFSFDQQEWYKLEREEAQWPSGIVGMVRSYRHIKEWGEARNIKCIENFMGAGILIVVGTIIIVILAAFDFHDDIMGPLGGIALVSYAVAVVLILRAMISILCEKLFK